MHAAVIRFELHIAESHSLKAKRAAIRPIIDGIRHRYHLSVAEVDHQDTWQRSAIAVAVVANDYRHVNEVLDEVERFVSVAAAVDMLEANTTWLDPA